ncbi:MAG: FCD domain-containing protein [Candidatus Bipolaricaulis sp.]|nr:FCD domain-containing protein [Candidatus Bipolaricaulis sp.]
MPNVEGSRLLRKTGDSWDTWQYGIFPQPKKSELALQYLEELLRNYPAGKKLPSEREVAAQLRITRSPVREALIALQMVGKVRIEPGVGAFAVAQAANASGASAFSLLAESESPFEISELRKVLEGAILAAAIVELTPESLQSIETAFQGMVDAHAAGDTDRFLDAHREFHLSIAVASGNSIFERLARWMLCHVMTQPIWEMIMHRRLRETSTRIVDSINEHREILDAIRARNARLAQALMAEHFAGVG